MFALLALLLAPGAHAGSLEFTAQAPVVVSLNGMQLAYDARGVATAQGLAGHQQVAVSDLRGHLLWSGPVDIPGDRHVRCTWAQSLRCEQVTVTQGATFQASDGMGGGVSMTLGPSGMTMTASDGVGNGVGNGASVGLATTGGMEVAPQAPPAGPPPAVPDRVQLVVRSSDGEWADVVVDGRVVMEIRNEDEASAWISPGTHTVEIREFMEDAAYTSGRLETGYASHVTLGITEGQPVRCYDHDGWTSY